MVFSGKKRKKNQDAKLHVQGISNCGPLFLYLFISLDVFCSFFPKRCHSDWWQHRKRNRIIYMLTWTAKQKKTPGNIWVYFCSVMHYVNFNGSVMSIRCHACHISKFADIAKSFMRREEECYVTRAWHFSGIVIKFPVQVTVRWHFSLRLALAIRFITDFFRLMFENCSGDHVWRGHFSTT